MGKATTYPISETVYNHTTELHTDIQWTKTGTEYYYECDSNYDVHHIVETDHGLLVRFVGDSYSQLFPNEKIGNRNEKEIFEDFHYCWA